MALSIKHLYENLSCMSRPRSFENAKALHDWLPRVFIGGTGRFESASGSTNFVVAVNFLTGGFDLTAVGKIDY